MLIFDTLEVNINILDYSYYDDSSLDANQTTGFDTSKITFSRHRMFRSFDFFRGSDVSEVPSFRGL